MTKKGLLCDIYTRAVRDDMMNSGTQSLNSLMHDKKTATGRYLALNPQDSKPHVLSAAHVALSSCICRSSMTVDLGLGIKERQAHTIGKRKKMKDLSFRHSELKELAALRWECDALSGKPWLQEGPQEPRQKHEVHLGVGAFSTFLQPGAASQRRHQKLKRRRNLSVTPPKKPAKRKPPNLTTRWRNLKSPSLRNLSPELQRPKPTTSLSNCEAQARGHLS